MKFSQLKQLVIESLVHINEGDDENFDIGPIDATTDVNELKTELCENYGFNDENVWEFIVSHAIEAE